MVLLSFLLFFLPIQDDIAKALQGNNVDALVEHFHTNVDMTLLDEEDVYSRQQASAILARFFQRHPVDRFEIKHSPNSKDGSILVIGDLFSGNHIFRVHYLLKENNGQQYIYQFRIEED